MKNPMKVYALGAVILTILSLAACQQNDAEETNLAKVPDSWIAERVEKAQARLDSSEAGKVVWAAMEAHGGLGNWYLKGPISFHFDYQPLGEGDARNTYQVVDTWRNQAVHYNAGDSTSMFGWNGEEAWMVAKDSTTFPYNTRFWSLTPYYFMGQPFVLDGEGVNLELLDPISYEGKENNVVKVSFAKGTGDAPDDYYVLYFNKGTHRLGVIRYIVSYPGYFKDGGHMPEKFMALEGSREVEGFYLPESYRTYWLLDDGKPGEYITKIELSEVKFKPELAKDYFVKPEGAKVVEGL